MTGSPTASIKSIHAPQQTAPVLINNRSPGPKAKEREEGPEWDVSRELRSVRGPRKRGRPPHPTRRRLDFDDSSKPKTPRLESGSLCKDSGVETSTPKFDLQRDQYTGPLVLTTFFTSQENGILSNINTDGESDEDMQEYLAQFAIIRSLPTLESLVDKWRLPVLPMQVRSFSQRRTLVLDLDETLVHSWINEDHNHDVTFKVSVLCPEDTTVYVRLRPHLAHFLEHVSEWFEVVVFTASQRIYADKLLSILDPQRRYFKHRVFRDSCVEVNGMYFKDLTLLGRDLAHTVIVDNLPQAFGLQLDNGIPIAPFYDNVADVELLKLLTFLQKLVFTQDVRPLISEKFRLRQMIHRC